jgi:hypothetical protein
MEEWEELKYDGRWGNAQFDKSAMQQIVVTEFNVFLGLRQRTFLSPRLHRALCCLSTLQPAIDEKAKEQGSLHALMNAVAIYKPVTVFIADVPNGLKAQLCLLKRNRAFKEIISNQNKELTAFTNEKLRGTVAEHLYCVAQLFKGNCQGTFRGYKLLRVTSDEKAAYCTAKANFSERRSTFVFEVTEDHDLIMTPIKDVEEEPKIVPDPNAKLEKELSLQAYDALNCLKSELRIFNPDFEKCDGLLAIAKSSMDGFESVRNAFSGKYTELKSEVERRRPGLATRADINETNALLREILNKLQTKT